MPTIFSFYTGLQSFNVEGKKATFYLMNTSPNRDNWAVSAKALDEALPTLIGKPIGLGFNYEAGHDDDVGEMRNVGVFTATENKGNYALAVANITDEKVLDLIKKGKLGPVSVVIQPYRMTCSTCGRKWEQYQDHYQCNNYHKVVESFVFNRVDFVKTPAYPQAGLLDLAASCIQSNSSAPLPLLAAAYEGSQTTTNNNNKKSFGEKHPMSETTNSVHLGKIESELSLLSASLKTLTTQNNELEARVKVLETENTNLKKERHSALVEKAIAARKAAGLGDETVDRVTFAASFSDSALETVITDAEKVLKAKHTGNSNKTGKTDQEYTETDENNPSATDLDRLTAALNTRRIARGIEPLKATTAAGGNEGGKA